MTKAQKADQTEAVSRLRAILSPGDTVYCVLRSVSRSGMSRVISFYKINGTERAWLDGYIGRACDYRRAARDGLKVGGCGMDMGFSVVYNLGRVLFPDGFKLAPGQHGRNGDKSGLDTDGGYALKAVWL